MDIASPQEEVDAPVLTLEPPVAQGAPHARAWDDAPLRTKITLLVLLAVVGGVLVAKIDSLLGHHFWVLVPGLALVALALLWLARHWVCSPLERLLLNLTELEKIERPHVPASLPLRRQDEVGRIARSVHQLSTQWVRGYHEARQLRRTLDHRIAQATREATGQLRQMAMRDPLTDLGNRRFLEEHLETLFNSVREAGDDLIGLSLDLDHFKAVNDTLGHAAGDELLVFLATLIRGSIRRHRDYAVRLGGDEFVVLMPGSTPETAHRFARQLSALFHQHSRAALPGTCQVSLSIGIASLGLDAPANGEELLRCADAKLYRAKRSGKNCIMIAPEAAQ